MIGLLITWKMGLFSDFQYGFRLLVELQILWQFYLIQLLAFNSSGYIWAVVLDISKVFFLKLDLMKFQVGFLALSLYFSVIDGFSYLWMGRLCKKAMLMSYLLFVPAIDNSHAIFKIFFWDTFVQCNCSKSEMQYFWLYWVNFAKLFFPTLR